MDKLRRVRANAQRHTRPREREVMSKKRFVNKTAKLTSKKNYKYACMHCERKVKSASQFNSIINPIYSIAKRKAKALFEDKSLVHSIITKHGKIRFCGPIIKIDRTVNA